MHSFLQTFNRGPYTSGGWPPPEGHRRAGFTVHNFFRNTLQADSNVHICAKGHDITSTSLYHNYSVSVGLQVKRFQPPIEKAPDDFFFAALSYSRSQGLKSRGYEHEGPDRNDGVDRARSLLDAVGLADRHDHYPIQLSGGEQQRVALARAFVSSPPLILADEPTGNLDTINGAHILEMLDELNRREGATLVLVTHDEALAERADRVIVLQDGLIVSDELTSTESSTSHASSPVA